jgi:hypothetical protein
MVSVEAVDLAVRALVEWRESASLRKCVPSPEDFVASRLFSAELGLTLEECDAAARALMVASPEAAQAEVVLIGEPAATVIEVET